MTAENNGTNGEPEGDDPFAYLYRHEGGDGSTAQQPGVPRRSFSQVRTVGERQYGSQQQGAQAGGHGQQPGYGRTASAHYAAPETVPGGRAAARQTHQSHAHNGHTGESGHGHGGRRNGGGRNHNGLLIGAIAVVAAVVLGIGAAIVFNSDDSADGSDQAAGRPGTSAGGGKGNGDSDAEKSADDSAATGKKTADGLPKEDAARLRLEGSATTAKSVPGAKANGGTYVTGLNSAGSSATWTTKVDKAGSYNLYVGYGVPGKDMHMSLSVNGKAHGTGLSMKNYAKAGAGEWEKGWTYTFATVQLKEGVNTMKISCGQGDQCDVNLDRVWLVN